MLMDIHAPHIYSENSGLEPEKMAPANDNLSNWEEVGDFNGEKRGAPKLVFGVLLILALGTLFYGFLSLSARIYGSNRQFEQNQSQGQPNESTAVADLLELQSKDTDKDGLTDYDEIYIYKTSAYLPDTDSDGYLDKEEIDSGHDPLCPAGADCRGTATSSGNGTATSTGSGAEDNQNATSTILTPEIIEQLNSLTPAQVRELLLQSGQMTQEQLDQIDDTTLMEVYKEALKGQ